jgi:hypothetical protein
MRMAAGMLAQYLWQLHHIHWQHFVLHVLS